MLRIVAVLRFQLGLTLHEPGKQRFILASRGVLPLGPEVVPVVEHVQHKGQQGRIQGGVGKFLLHKAQAAAARQNDPPRVRAFHPGQQTQQGGFARAVGTRRAARRNPPPAKNC